MKLLNDNYKIVIFVLIFLSFSSFFLGFYFDENSAGAGGLFGDFSLNWGNLQIFLNNDLLTAINYTDGADPDNVYNSSRPPLVYILHKLFNPFLETQISFRRSVFILSLSGPILFYLCLKQKFKKEDNLLLALIASTIFLSPYFRTSAYWGYTENFTFIAMLLSYYFLHNFLGDKKIIYLKKEVFYNTGKEISRLEYHDNGRFKRVLIFEDGLKVYERKWNIDGFENTDQIFITGTRTQADYYISGQLKYECIYKGQLKHGMEWWFDEERNPLKVNLYNNGKKLISHDLLYVSDE